QNVGTLSSAFGSPSVASSPAGFSKSRKFGDRSLNRSLQNSTSFAFFFDRSTSHNWFQYARCASTDRSVLAGSNSCVNAVDQTCSPFSAALSQYDATLSKNPGTRPGSNVPSELPSQCHQERNSRPPWL